MPQEGTTITTVLQNQTRSNPGTVERTSSSAHSADSTDLRFGIEARFIGLEQYKNGSDHLLPEWLAELREMRGRVCYEEGHRPFFRLPDARILPLTDSQPSALFSALGKDRFEEILSRMGTTRARTCEASRWLVVPECRKGLGTRIVAASWAIAQWLSLEAAFVLAGTRQKQDCALIRMGARAIDGLPLFPSDTFDDDLRVLYFDVSHPSDWMAKQIDQMTSMLKLEELRQPENGGNDDLTRREAEDSVRTQQP